MSKLYVINATRNTQRIVLVRPNVTGAAHKFVMVIPAGQQELMGDEFSAEDQKLMMEHLERFGGRDITEMNGTPENFFGLAYRREQPAKADQILAAHNVDMTRREKLSAQVMIDGVKAFDGKLRRGGKIPNPAALVTETVIEETAPLGEKMPSGGLRSAINVTLEGGDLKVA
ncbi:MAG: hypothetical protein ACYDBH_01105 [Acidobacteriaceae bacterium]